MAQPTGPAPIRPIQQLVSSKVGPEIEQLLAKAKTEDQLGEKQKILEKVFSTIKASAPSAEVSQFLFRTLHQYAKDTCYNIEGPNDEELGMKETRCLMLWSLLGQRTGSVKEITDHESLAALKQQGPGEDPLLHPEPVLSSIASWTDERKEHLAQTICQLSYAAQNIEAYRTKKDLPWQFTCYRLVLEIWQSKQEKSDFKEKQAEFRYNKDALLLELAGKNEAERIAALNPVLDLFAEAWGKDSEKFQGKLSQVRNKQAISEFQTKTEGWLTRALAYSKEAVSIREAMTAPENPEENYTHFFLLANARQVLAKLLTEGEPTADQLQQADELIQKSIAFADEWMAKGKADNYFEGYYKVGALIKEKLKAKS